MEACSQLLRKWQKTSGLPLPEFTEMVTAKVLFKENMQCYGFSRSLLWKLVCTVVKYGPFLLWHMIPQKSPPLMSFTWASWKDAWVSRKVLSSGAGFRPSLQPSWSPLVFPFLFAVEELYGTRYQSGSFSLINVGSGFHCLRSFFSFFFFVKKGTAWYSLRAPRNRSDAHFFLLVQLHHTILEQFTLFEQSSSWESCAGWPICKLKWYVDLPDSARTPKFPTSQQFWMPYDLASLSIWNSSSSLCANISTMLERAWQLTPHDNHHSSRIMRTYHTHFGEPLGIAPGWWDDRKRNHKPVLPI